MSDIDLSLLGDFIEEAVEHLEEMESNLLKLRAGEDNKDLCNEIFRPIHSIKGAAQFVGLDRIALLTHRMEDLLDKLRQGLMAVTPSTIDILMAGRDRVQMLVSELQESQEEHSSVEDLVILLDAHIAGEDNPVESMSEPAEQATATESIAVEEPEVIDWDEVDTVLETQELSSLLVNDAEAPPSSFEHQEQGDDADAIRQEVHYSADHDAELFGIFRQHLQDRLDVMNMLGGALKVSEEPNEIFDALNQQIERLRSAANYMAFSRLLEFYDDWTQWINSAIAGGEGDRAAATAYMGRKLEILNSLLPHMEETGSDISEPDVPTIAEAADSIRAEAFHSDDFQAESFQGGEFEVAQFHENGAHEKSVNTDELDDLGRFVADARIQLDTMDESLGVLRDSPVDGDALESLFRVSHTLKGSAQFAGIPRVAALSGKMEDMLYPLQEQGVSSTDQLLLLNLGYATLLQLIEELEQGKGEVTSIDGLLERFDQHGKPVAPKEVVFQESEEPSEIPTTYSPHEENDQELFGIFLNQLKELFNEIRGAAEKYESDADTATFTATSQNVLSRLGSAASYMGYESLYQLYREWKQKLDALTAAPNGNDEAADVVEDYIIRAYAVVSGSGDTSSMQPMPVETTSPTRPEPVAKSITENSAQTPINTAQSTTGSTQRTASVNRSAVASQSNKLKTTSHTTLSDATMVPKSSDAASVTTDAPKRDDEHFVRLTQALDESLGAAEQQEYETLHGVFEEMLDSSEDPVKEKAKPAASKPAPAPKPKTEQPKPTAAVASAAKQPGKQAVAQVKSTPAKKKPAAAAKPAALPSNGEKKPAVQANKSDDNKPKAINKPTGKAIKKSIRVESDRIDTLMNQVGELVVDRSYFMQLFNEMNDLQRHLKEELGVDKNDLKHMRIFSNRLSEAINSLTRTSNELQEGVMKVRMLPISQLFSRYPRLIHDLTNDTKKKVHLQLKGEETELDKMIVEELSDPLIHIIRNAVDHGLEPVDERRRLGKSEEGTLTVEAYQEGNQIVIEVMDDGRGIDPEKLKAKAMQKGMFNREELERMPQQELIRLIMQPGFSTADKISRTSGRGVGMDVVKKNIERLNGTIDISSKKGISTRIRLRIPLTLAIIQALQVRVAERSFTIPLSNILETLNIEGMTTSFIEGTEVLHLRGRTLPIFRLGPMFGLDRDEEQIPFVVVVSAGTEQVGLVVDELVGQDEVVIKPLAEYVQEKSGFSGATIIGDGRISLILDVAELIGLVVSKQMARQQGLVQKRRLEAEGGGPDARA